MSKKGLLEGLAREIAADNTLPLLESNLVFGEGDPEARVVFIGEAPGANEDRLGRPFVGRGGQLLDDCIKSIGWQRQRVYITNIVKRRPPENRDPLPEEIEAYKPYLTRQLEILVPDMIVPLGRFAMNYFLPEARIMRDQGKIFWVSGHKVVPILHPAAALRSTEMMKTFRESFQKLPDILIGKVAVESVKMPEVLDKPAIEDPSKFQDPLF